MAEVIVDVAASGIDRPLHYSVPPALEAELRPGHRVLVPLQNRIVEGFVIGRLQESHHEALRPIHRLVDPEPVFGPEEVDLAAWMAHRYLSLQVDGLRCLMPPHVRLGLRSRIRTGRRPGGGKRYRLAPGVEKRLGTLLEEKSRRAPAQARLLRTLTSHPPEGDAWPRKALLERAEASPSALQALVREQWVVEEEGDPRFGGGVSGLGGEGPPGTGSLAGSSPLSAGGSRAAVRSLPALTDDQARALALIESRLREGDAARPVLLQGVTGSGKTEVYMRAAERVLAEGGQALVLVPEIVLTPQMVARFRERFGSRVALLHSRLAPGERLETWWRIRRGQAPLVVGTRSAVFAPLDGLRLIVVDEEHEPSYKQEESPRYHAREVAQERARRSGALLVLGSATPSAETYVRALRGELDTAVLATRVHGRPLPRVELVDMREELRQGHRSILSRRLMEEMGRVLGRGEQVMLFLNRRGYSTFLLCRECGGVVTCPDCAVTLTYHATGDPLRCHYCDRRERVPQGCPHCGSPLLRRFGAGTQRVEEAVKAVFPDARVLRMDWDTTRRKGEMERMLEAFRSGEAQVLVGTQMIAKGHDFPQVALVGAIAADSSLHLPDFRSAERTFQLLIQAAGRAGRAEVEGRVIVQSYNPAHYSVRCAQHYDLPGFFQEELRFRRAGGYPPYKHLARLLFVGEHSEEVFQVAKEARRHVGPDLARRKVDVLGPAPAPVSRLQGKYRWHMLIKGSVADEVRDAAAALLGAARRRLSRGVAVAVDVDPISVM